METTGRRFCVEVGLKEVKIEKSRHKIFKANFVQHSKFSRRRLAMADEKKTPAPEEPVSGKSPDAGKHDPNAPAQGENDTPEKPEGSPVAETPKPPEEKVPEDKSQTGVSKNTSTGVAGGCHYAGIALCSSRTR